MRKGAAGSSSMLSASRITPGIASGATLPELNGAGIAIRASAARLVAIDQRHVGATTQKMPGRADPDNAGADHDDGVASVSAHFKWDASAHANVAATAHKLPSGTMKGIQSGMATVDRCRLVNCSIRCNSAAPSASSRLILDINTVP